MNKLIRLSAVLSITAASCFASAQFFSPDNLIPRAHYAGEQEVTFGVGQPKMSALFFTIQHGEEPPTGGGTIVVPWSENIIYTLFHALGGQKESPGNGIIRYTDLGGDNYQSEMTQLNISGGSLPSGFMLRESPTLASLGHTSITSVPGGYIIDSYIDVFLELSTDGGQNWTPGSNAERLRAFAPEPATLSALLLGSAVFGLRHRRRRLKK